MENYDDNYHGGRPTLFTAKRAKLVIEAVRRGQTYKLSAAYAGISYSTLNRWRAIGRDDDAPAKFRKFWKQLEQASGEAALRMIKLVEVAAQTDWKAATWILSRRHPDQWGERRERESELFDPSTQL